MRFSKVILILGIALLITGALTPNDYNGCHSDFEIAGQICYPDFVYEIGEAAFYVGIFFMLSSFYLMKRERERKPADIIFAK